MGSWLYDPRDQGIEINDPTWYPLEHTCRLPDLNAEMIDAVYQCTCGRIYQAIQMRGLDGKMMDSFSWSSRSHESAVNALERIRDDYNIHLREYPLAGAYVRVDGKKHRIVERWSYNGHLYVFYHDETGQRRTHELYTAPEEVTP